MTGAGCEYNRAMDFSFEQYKALENLAVLTAQSNDVEDVYTELASIVEVIIPNEGMIFNLLTPSRHQFVVQIRTGDIPATREVGQSYDLKGTFVDQVVSSGEWQTESFTNAEDLVKTRPGLRPAFDVGYRAWLAVPVFAESELIGTLHVQRKQSGLFTEDDAAFLGRVAVHLGSTVHKHRLVEVHRLADERSDAVLAVDKILSEISELSESIDLTAEVISQSLSADRFVVSSYDPETERSTDIGIWGVAIPEWDSMEEKPLRVHAVSHFSTDDRARIVPTDVILSAEAETQPGLAYAAKAGLVSMMSCSLFVGGLFRGTISVRSKRPHAYDEVDLVFLQEIAAQLNQYIAAEEARESERVAIRESERLGAERRIAAVQMEFQNAKGRVIDSVSHELRTPLTVITARADLLTRHIENPSSRVSEGVASIRSAATELKQLIDRLIDHADRTNTSWTPDYATSTFGELGEDLLVAVLKIDGLDPSRVQISSDDETREVYCDRQHISSAMLELVDNALKYGPPEGVARVKMIGIDGAISISVEDDGQSVKAENADDLFDAFERGTAWGDSFQRGAGLGLPFVSMVAQSHSGEAWFRKGESGNSIFGITLPFAG